MAEQGGPTRHRHGHRCADSTPRRHAGTVSAPPECRRDAPTVGCARRYRIPVADGALDRDQVVGLLPDDLAGS
ncbi:hypothetical protein [Plantactinospora sp. CA-290183]|uniref:hypothetical protein n=1 Tax=Plantactinospora sp. CA-290183 TaxID=3240006 RepID=UPI003D928ECD